MQDMEANASLEKTSMIYGIYTLRYTQVFCKHHNNIIIMKYHYATFSELQSWKLSETTSFKNYNVMVHPNKNDTATLLAAV